MPGLKTGFREEVALYRASLPEHVRVLFDRYRLCDVAVKVVGIGSVGTACGVGLFMAADDDPLFLQIEEAKASLFASSPLSMPTRISVTTGHSSGQSGKGA